LRKPVALLICLALLLVTGTSLTSFALTPQEAKNLKPVKVLVVTEENTDHLWSLLLGNSTEKVIDLRIGPRFLTTELQVRVRKWVSDGGGILVYGGVDDTNDSAAIFFPKIEYTDLPRWQAVIAKAVPNVNTPVLNKVSKAKIFMRRLPKLKPLPGSESVPILQISDTQRIAFVTNYGKGRIAYLPTGTLYPAYPVKEYDNRRLFLNIFRWMAKEKVPE